jgi:hypothetical protein
MGSRDAHAQSLGGFYDSCAPDFLYFAPGYVGKDVRVGYSAVHIGRPHCPWLIIDVYGAYGQDMYFNGQWAYSQPSSSYQCNGAKYSYVVARKADDLLYWIVGQGTAVGTWTNWFGHQFCLWTLQSDGTGPAKVDNSPYDYYRLLLRAWEGNAYGNVERIPAGNFGVNVPPIP